MRDLDDVEPVSATLQFSGFLEEEKPIDISV